MIFTTEFTEFLKESSAASVIFVVSGKRRKDETIKHGGIK